MRPIRSPTLLLIRMNAADTNASSAIAACTLLTVVSRSLTTDEIDTFISEVSTTSTNIAIASRTASLGLPEFACSEGCRCAPSLTCAAFKGFVFSHLSSACSRGLDRFLSRVRVDSQRSLDGAVDVAVDVIGADQVDDSVRSQHREHLRLDPGDAEMPTPSASRNSWISASFAEP